MGDHAYSGFRTRWFPGGSLFNYTASSTSLGTMNVGSSSKFTATANVTYYFDANLNAVTVNPASTPLKICDGGSYGWVQSPISLIWEDDVDLDRDITFTKFPIDPTATGKWYLWKASAKAPLLVHDPEHTGKITSGEQLFGNWTFGGKHFASLDSASPQSSKWKNGFEALATLDSNSDGEISGQELEPLALWFDKNRNGISEPGEVIPVSELDTLALYYSPDRVETETNNIIATRGYKRIKDGKEVTGRSVDWHSDSADTRSELINKQLAYVALCNKLADPTETAPWAFQGNVNPVSDAVNISAAAAPKVEKNTLTPDALNGMWKWVSDDKQFPEPDTSPKGILGFSIKENSLVTGHSYSELSFSEQSKLVRSSLTISALNGKVSVDKYKKILLHFTIQTQEGPILESTATLSDDGLELLGESRAVSKAGSKSVSISYSWRATKLRPPDSGQQSKSAAEPIAELK